MKTSVRSHLTVQPGQTASIDIEVTNTSPIIDGVTAVVDGINPGWVSLDSPVVPLFPDESGLVRLNFDIPWDSDAGDYLVVVRVLSVIDPTREALHDFWLAVEPRVGIHLELTPQSVTGGRKAMVVATLVNSGNVATSVFMRAIDQTRQVDTVVHPPVIDLQRGESREVHIMMRGRRRWTDSEYRTVDVTATFDDEEDPIEQVINFTQKPWVARGFITAATLTAIVALWALIFTLVMNQIRQNEVPAKDVASAFIIGELDILRSAVDGQIEGTVSAATTGGPTGRVVVEAMRLIDGELVTVASVATNDDGTFAFESLLPGSYKFKFSGEGLDEVIFPEGDETASVDTGSTTELPDATPDGSGDGAVDGAAVDEGDAPPGLSVEGSVDGSPDGPTVEDGTIKIAPGVVFERDDELKIALDGELGGLSGEIALPPGSPDIPLTATITQLDALGPVEPLVVDVVDGNLLVEDVLPTPGEYQVTIDGEGFDAQQFAVSLGAGDSPILNTVTLSAGSGGIAGLVRDSAGLLLGLVDVTVSSGDFFAKTKTSTVGDLGGFRVDGLETPATYVLSFSLDGFSSETITLDLGPGESRTDVTKVEVELVGGNGRITGTAVDSSGDPVGGVIVTVIGDGFRSETATLTTGGAGGGAGTFSMSGLAAPGDYAITLSSDLHQTETLAVTFDDAGEVELGQIEMLVSVSDILGTVTGPNGPAGGLTVTLNNGLIQRTTTSATSPAGVFSFTNVAPGTYTVQADGPKLVTGVVLLTVELGSQVEVDVVVTEESTP